MQRGFVAMPNPTMINIFDEWSISEEPLPTMVGIFASCSSSLYKVTEKKASHLLTFAL